MPACLTRPQVNSAKSGFGRVFTELHFETADTAYPAVQLSVELDCRVDLLEFLHTDAEGLVIFVRLQSEDGAELRTRLESIDVDAEVRVLQSVGEELLAEYVPEQSIVGTLARNGVIPQSAVATDGLASITGVVPGDRDSRGVVERVRRDHPSVEFTGKRDAEVVAPLVTEAGVRSLFASLLTDRQWEAVRLAYERGYFDQPQGHSQTELADEMGISQKTFSQHLNAAQRKLLSVVFEG